MVYNPEGRKGEGQEWILVNPRIVSSSKGSDVMEEGCLSFQDQSKDLYITGDVRVCSQAQLPLDSMLFYAWLQPASWVAEHAISGNAGQRYKTEQGVVQGWHKPPATHKPTLCRVCRGPTQLK